MRFRKVKFKLLYGLLALVLLILVVVVIMFPRSSTMKVSLLNIPVGMTSESTTVKAALPYEYSITAQTQVEPDIAGETKVIKFTNDATEAMLNVKEKTMKDLEKYFQPNDEQKLKNDPGYIISSEHQDLVTRRMHFEIVGCWNRNHKTNMSKTPETSIVYSSKDKYIVKVLLDDVRFTGLGLEVNDLNCSMPAENVPNNQTVDMIYEYTIVRDTKNNEYQVYDFKLQAVKDLDAFKTQITNVEKNEYNSGRQLTGINAFTPENAKGYNYDLVRRVDQNKVKNIFITNGPKTVTISAKGPNGMGAASGYGFFVRKGVIATSWKVAEGLLKDGIVDKYAIGFDGKLNKISGVVSASPELDVAFLKLDNELGEPVVLGNPSSLKAEEPIVVIGSPMGLSPITRVGLYLSIIQDSIPSIRNSLPLGEGDTGSPLFNLKGEVVGLNTSTGENKFDGDTSLARPVTLFKTLVQKLNDQSFKNIKETSFEDLAKIIANPPAVNNQIKVPETNNLWKAYKKLPDITQYKSVEFTESYISGDYLSIRYINKIKDYMKTNIITEAYGKKLEKSGFKLVYRNGGRLTYIKGKEVIRIAERFDYISVIYGVINE